MERIIIFDSVCNLCNKFVLFIIRNDHKGNFKFASLQSDYASQLLKNSGEQLSNPDFLIYIKENVVLCKSTAVLMILKDLGSFWKLFYILMIIPRVFRNFFYDLLAKHRYLIFGKKETCMLPTPKLQSRFLE